ncbi:MAG: TetR/AcrR family transcriptional regulator [Solirubrobacterales bacterium]
MTTAPGKTRAGHGPSGSRGGRTRGRLLEAAVELLEEGGYASASVAAIASRAGVAVGALYRHFPSKAEFFVEIVREMADRELAALGETSAREAGAVAEKLDAIVAKFTHRALAQPRLAWALGYEPVDPLVDAERLAYRQTYRERLASLLRHGISSGELPAQDADLAAAAVIGAISEALASPLSPVRGVDVPAERIVVALQEFCRRAIGARDPSR